MNKILFKWSELKATFWFVPVMIIGLAIVLSLGLVYIDIRFDFSQSGLSRYFIVNNSDSARSILSTISGAMIGVAGTVFSVTLVALTLASSQFGPRLIKNFMYVRLNQVVLGSYISTYLYCLFVLNAIKEEEGNVFIPSLSIMVAIFAAVANIVLLIVFIHHIAVSIQADKVISDIADFLSRQMEHLFPEKLEEEKEISEAVNQEEVIASYRDGIPIKAPQRGYLQYVDHLALQEAVSAKNAMLELNYRSGAYLVEGLRIGTLHTNEEWEESELKRIYSQLVIGKTKTSQQDLEYSIHQMVEIAARALSPGVNDPYTAISCIDNLSATMSYLAQAKFPSKYRFDENGTLRMVLDPVDFEGLLDAAFNQIRQFSAGNAAVIIRLMEALITIQKFTRKKDHKKAVAKHAQMVLSIGKQSIEEENDLQDLQQRAEKLLPAKTDQQGSLDHQ